MSDIFDKLVPVFFKHFNTSEVKAIIHANLEMIEDQESKGVDPEKIVSMLKRVLEDMLNVLNDDDKEFGQ